MTAEPAATARGGGPAGGVDRRERDALRDDVLRNPVEPDAHLGDHGERPFRPDEQAREVVAGGRLPRPAARPDDRPVGEHRLEAEDVGAHLPVADRRRPGRIRRRHASERRVRTGIDREEEPVLAGRALERRPRHACLDGRAEILRSDLHDPVQAGEIEADAAARRDHVALEARAGAERRHGHPAVAGDRHDARDLVRRGRVDDKVGPLRPVKGDVGRVEVALGVAVRDARVLAERLDECFAELLDGDGQLNSASDGSPPATLSTAQRRLLLGRALGGEPVVHLAIREEVRVAAERLLEALCGREHQAVVALGAPVEPLDLADEAPPAARPVARAVELPAEREVGVDVLGGGGPLELAECLAHRGELRRADGRRAEPGRKALQAEPRRVDLLEVLARQPADEGATGRADRDEALALEPAEARPHRSLRDAEPGGELPLHELRALGQLPGDDQRAERLCDSLLDRLPLLERLDRLVGELELHRFRTSRIARTPRAASCRRGRRRGSHSLSQPSPRPR